MEKMNKNKMVSIIIDVLYYLCIFAFLLWMKVTYSLSVEADTSVFFGFAGIILGLLILTGNRFNKLTGFILSFIYGLYLVAQMIYFRGFGSYFRFSTAVGLFKEVSEVGGAIEELVHPEDFIPLYALLGITIVFVLLDIFVKKGYRPKWFIRLLSIPFIVLGIIVITSMESDIAATANGYSDFDIYKTDYYLYDTISSPASFVNKFGLLTYGLRDGEIFITRSSLASESKEEIDEYFSEKDSVITENEYTGLFEGKSLIVIQAESLMNMGINEELTPTLYAMAKGGIEFTNYDTPLLVGSTSDTEFMANTSFIPETEGYPICYEYINNTYPVTLGNLFKEEGYSTYAYHNNYAEYYNRNITFANYGYDFYDSYLLGLENLEPDSSLSDNIAWMLSEKDQFMSYWVSYSGHQPYSYGEVGASEENVAKVKELYPDLDEDFVVYLAKQMDLDQALNHIFNEVFDWQGIRDDVVIILFGDHAAKGLDFSKGSNVDKVLGFNSEDTPSAFYTPMFIYSTNLAHEEVDKYTTALDLLPTIMNLFNIDYDKEHVFGEDIFSLDYDGFCFDADGNYFNSGFYYDAVKNETEVYNGYSKTKAEELVYDFNRKRQLCNQILKIDYFGE